MCMVCVCVRESVCMETINMATASLSFSQVETYLLADPPSRAGGTGGGVGRGRERTGCTYGAVRATSL